MQVGIDVTCIDTNFGGCRLSSFGDIAAFKNGQFSLSDHGLQLLLMLIPLQFLALVTLQTLLNGQKVNTNVTQSFPNFTEWAEHVVEMIDYSPWSAKILIYQNWLEKFMEVGIDS